MTLNEALKAILSLLKEGRLAEARGQVDFLQQTHPDDPNVHAVSAFCAVKEGKPEDAITHYQLAISKEPGIADWHYHLGRAHETLNQHLEASRQFQRAAELAPSIAAYRWALSQSLLQAQHAALGLPPIGREAQKTYIEKQRSGFFRQYLSGEAILDIGFRGDFAQAVPIVPQATGIDLDTPGYDGLHLPYPDQSQDAIYSSHCLEHLPDPVAALREWHRAIKIGGYLVICVPHQHLYERKANPPSIWNPDHKHFFTPGKLLQVVEAALAPNTYRIRHLADNDHLYDYQLAPNEAPGWCYEIEIVIERIKAPPYREYTSTATALDQATASDNAGVSAWQAGQINAALKHFQAAAANAPQWFQPYWHIGVCQHRLRQYPAAINAYEQALTLNPDHATLRYHYAKALKDSGRLEQAQAAYTVALAQDPDNPEIRYSQGLLHLLRGDWLAGWPGYELRLAGSDRADKEHRPKTGLPLWTGESAPPESSLIIYAEQGMGDTLMVFRFARQLRKFFRRVKYSVQQPLVRLLATNAPEGVEVITRIAEPIDETGYTHHILSLSIMACCQTTPENLPSVPYLIADEALRAKWEQRLSAEKRLKVGIAWAGGSFTDAPGRDMPYAEMAPLLAREEIAWVSLQKAGSNGDSHTLIDWMGEISDMADTAALIAHLDLVIAVDTAVAHLAGALGKPVWLLNRFESEWRWMSNRTDTPWYPSMRIFSETAPGDWAGVVQQIGATIEQEVRK